ncbi:DUF805 domain-containing protein [Chryseobacterium sp. R2A-55]|uniref:DUF805 domain-containing protein n=1 Tax=Chryseobacterium sp. R2A-55 TaxID=2744445 RepID=UPI001F387286|nr:DUF805 domain-containing protein [Chryseobacterium sp. R2A-55]
MFKNPFSFDGRIRRTEFGISYLIYTAFAVAAQFFLSMSRETNNPALIFVFLGAYLPLFWFLLAQGAKRCHDRGNSGWFQLIPFYVLWMLFADSEVGENEYGPNPKGIGNATEINEIGRSEAI